MSWRLYPSAEATQTKGKENKTIRQPQALLFVDAAQI
jgi:hypothetical protein